MRGSVPLVLVLVSCGGRIATESRVELDAQVDDAAEDVTRDATPAPAPAAGGFPIAIENASAYDVAVGPADRIFVVGDFAGIARFGSTKLVSAGATDAFVALFDREGRMLWVRGFGDAAEQVAYHAVATADGGVVVSFETKGAIDLGSGPLPRAGDERDAVIASFDASGAPRWHFRVANANPIAIASDARGGIIASGSPYQPVDLGAGASRLSFLFALGPSGEKRWVRRFGGSRFVFSESVAVDGDGATWVAGSFNSDLTFADGLTMADLGNGDAFVAKFDGMGERLWSRRFGGPASDAAYGLAIAPDGHAVVVGEHGDAADFGAGPLVGDSRGDIFVMDLAPDGTTTWAHSFASAGWDTAHCVKVSSNGIVVTGHVGAPLDLGSGPSSFGGKLDALVLSLERSGAPRRRWVTGGADYDLAIGVDFLSTGTAVVTGRFHQSADFGTPMTADTASFLVALTP